MREWALLGFAIALPGCGEHKVTPVNVGSHNFGVPEGYLVKERLLSLPKEEIEGLYFTPDPTIPEKEQVLVIVDTIQKFCTFNNPPVIDQVPRACAVARGQAAQPHPGKLRKAPRFPGNEVHYDYKGEDGAVAVSCSAEPGQSGSCSATFAWRDLVWDAMFDEQWVPRLDELRAEVARRLDEWSADA
jgi:hypothetical protein